MAINDHTFTSFYSKATGMQRTRGRSDYDYEPVKRPQERVREYDYAPKFDSQQEYVYRSLCVYGINPRIPSDEIQEYLMSQYHRFGEFNVKVINAGENRLAFLNFRHPEEAREAKHAKKTLYDLGPYIRVEPVYPKPLRSPSPNSYGRETYPSGSSSYRSRETREPSQYTYAEYEEMYSEIGKSKDHKFPYHLNHIPPENDPNATRTLFIGNVDIEIAEDALRDIFERYGRIDEIDIKRPSQGNAFAFIKFLNVDMAHRAKVDMSGRYIGRYQCKIGYGKPTPTNCLWIGGLGPWVKPEILEREFDRFGVINRIEWPHGKGYAYVLFETIDAAASACKEMKGFLLGGPDHPIRVDFTEQTYMPSKALSPKASSVRDDNYKSDRRSEKDLSEPPHSSDKGQRTQPRSYPPERQDYRGSESDHYAKRETREDYDRISVHSDRRKNDNGYKGRAPKRTPPPYEEDVHKSSRNSHRENSNSTKKRRTVSPISDRDTSRDSKADTKRTSKVVSEKLDPESVDSLDCVIKIQPVVWCGALVLKNSAFATKMHLVSGDVHLVDTLMRDQSSTELPVLKITQRLRLDQPKLEEVGRRVTVSGTGGHAVLLAQPGMPDAVEEANTNVQQRPLKNLVTYLKQKEAAGVISLPPNPGKDSNLGVLHAFPPCSFGQEFLTKQFPKLGTDLPKEDHLVVIVVKGAA